MSKIVKIIQFLLVDFKCVFLKSRFFSSVVMVSILTLPVLYVFRQLSACIFPPFNRGEFTIHLVRYTIFFPGYLAGEVLFLDHLKKYLALMLQYEQQNIHLLIIYIQKADKWVKIYMGKTLMMS